MVQVDLPATEIAVVEIVEELQTMLSLIRMESPQEPHYQKFLLQQHLKLQYRIPTSDLQTEDMVGGEIVEAQLELLDP